MRPIVKPKGAQQSVTMKLPNISGSDGKSRMSAQRYIKMAATLLHKETAKKGSCSMSQGEGNDQSKVSPKSGNTPESHKFGCKRQRVALVTEQETCSRDGPIAPGHPRHSLVKDVNTQESSRSAQVDVSPASNKKEGKLCGKKDVCAQEFSRSAQGNSLPTSNEKEEEKRGKKDGVEGSPHSPSAGSDNVRLVEYWAPVQLSNAQLEQYFSTLLTNFDLLSSSLKRGSLERLQDVLVALRKCCDHPYVLDPSLQSSFKDRSPSRDYLSIGIETSGKLQLLSKLLAKVREQGLRVLIVYKTIDSLKNGIGIGYILDDFICQSFGEESYVHIFTQGCVHPREKQAAVDLSNDRTGGRSIILTEYSSSAVNIRLSSADAVILFNGDWNPVNDIRALQKMKLHTESDNLKVFRLYSVYTLEEKVLCLARDGAAANSNMRYLSWSVCHTLLAWGAAYLYDRLDILHETAAFGSAKFSEDDFVCSIMRELSDLLSSKFDDSDVSCSITSKAHWVDETYCRNIKLHGEREVQSLDDVPPHVFWSSLLDGWRPRWVFLPEKSEKRRVLSCQRPSGIPEDGMGAAVHLPEGKCHGTKRRKMVPRPTEGAPSHQERLGVAALMVAMKRTSCKPAGESKSIKSSSSSQSSTSLEQGTKETGSEERMNPSGVHNDTSSHTKHGDETHKQRTLEPEKEKKKKTLEFFVTKTRRTEALKEKYHQLEQDLIANQYCESSCKQEKSKLDEKLKSEFQELCREMDERWANLRAADLSTRNDIEGQGLTRLESLKSPTGAVPEEPDYTQMNASSAPVNSTNPCMSPLDLILESESGIKTLTNGQMPTLSAETCSPVPPVEGSSQEISPVSLPMEQLMAIPVDSADEQIHSALDPAIVDEPTLLGSSSVKQSDTHSAALTLVNLDVSPVSSPPLVSKVDPDTLKESQHCVPNDLLSNQGPGEDFHDASDGILVPDVVEISQGLSSSSMLNNVNQYPLGSGQGTSYDLALRDISEVSCERLSSKEVTGSDSDKPASPVSLPLPSVPRTSDNVNAPGRSPFSVPELEANTLREHWNRSPQNDMPCSLPIIESQEHGTHSAKDSHIPGVSQDDELACEIPDAIPIGELEVPIFLPEEAPGNQHVEANRMHDTVSRAGSTPCIPLPNCVTDRDCGFQGSLNGGTAVGEPRQQFPTNFSADLSSSGWNGLTPGQMLLEHCMDQGPQPPIEQFPAPTLPLSSGNGIMGQSSLASCHQYAGNATCSQQLQSPAMMQIHTHSRSCPADGGTRETSQQQVPDSTSYFFQNCSTSSYVGVNSHVSAILCPLQTEIEKIQNVEAEATKMHEDKILQLGSARDREMALLNEKYERLLQDAKNDLTRKKKELQMRHEKINAHKALASTWRLVKDEDSPIDKMFDPPSLVQSAGRASSNGVQTNAFFHSPQIVSQFPDLISTNPVARAPYPPMYHSPMGFQAGWTPHCPSPHLSSYVPSLAIQSLVFNPYQFGRQALNFCPSGSSNTQLLTNLEHRPFPHGAPV